MTRERLNLYKIDMKYIRNLHHIDNRVSSVSPQIGKQHRIYVGLVVICNQRKYLIPLSHPVEEKQLILINIKNRENDSIAERHYKQLCIDELNWCRKNADIIINKANCLYNLCINDSNYKGKERCLDFKMLEVECDKYNKMNGYKS